MLRLAPVCINFAAVNEELLHIDRLSTGYAGRALTQDFCCRAAAGELIALIGPNGTGKSTLLRTLAGLLPPLQGSVRWQGTSLTALTPRARARRVGVVLSAQALAAPLTVQGLAAMGRMPYTGLTGCPREADRLAVRQALELAGVAHLSHRPLHALSDGEKARAFIAKALAQQTPAILLDEPTAHLDIRGKWEVLSLLARLAHEQGRLVICSTHDLEPMLHVADRVWLLSDVRCTDGTPQTLAADGSIARTFAVPGLDFDVQRKRFFISDRQENEYDGK